MLTWRGSLPLFLTAVLFSSIGLRAQDLVEGHGKITPAFAKQLLPLLHDINALQPGKSYSPAMLTEIGSLDKLTRNSDEGNLMAFVKDELMRFVQAEKRPAQTLRRKKCVQELTTQAGNLEYAATKTCGDISNSMYQ